MPPLRFRIIGRTLSFVASRAPWLWPLIRPLVRRFWNRMAGGWDTRMSAERLTALEEGLKHAGQPRRILEIGTGTGSGAAAIAERFPGAELTAVDLSSEMVRRAQERLPQARFEVADAASLPFPDDSFDLVVQLNVPVYSRELSRVTAPAGRVLIASTFGPRTPYYTPHALLRRKFTEVDSGQAGPGDWFIGRPA
ncbi:MAG: class I SAM-dependent methyltransferase, partial [Thermoleophilaceae bacterium]